MIAFRMNGQTNPTTLPIPRERRGPASTRRPAEMFPDYSRSRLTQWIKAGDLCSTARRWRRASSWMAAEIVTLNARAGPGSAAAA